ncbi:hypothetical protein RISK_006563 [Rhodopirellula islandica]|uniref:Uncharacterized protein n=1 Tax=Rhodopirellula islandica TaxID=595434 RepID=A0A0J1B3S6_RHOIS|nr:hypothetical protein RISK_006563 [Rhodopirellula islandica]
MGLIDQRWNARAPRSFIESAQTHDQEMIQPMIPANSV